MCGAEFSTDGGSTKRSKDSKRGEEGGGERRGRAHGKLKKYAKSGAGGGVLGCGGGGAFRIASPVFNTPHVWCSLLRMRKKIG